MRTRPIDVIVSEADVRKALGGDQAALEMLLAATWPRAFRIALSMTAESSTAEEAAQDALVLIATRLPSLRDPAAFAAWSTRIIVNATTSTLRRRVRHAQLDAHGVAAGFEDALAERLDVLRAVASLPLWLRAPLVLRYVDGLTSHEIGLAVGAPSATIRFRLALARRRLASLLGPGVAASEEFA